MFYISKLIRISGVALTLCFVFAPMSAAAATIRAGGTGSALGTVMILADAFQASRPDTKINVMPALGSSGGIKAVTEGKLDIGLSARALKPAERAQGLAEREIGRTPLVLASMRSHAGFTLSEVAGIFSGTLKTWPDGSPLRPILRPEADTETQLLRAISPEIDRALTIARARQGVHTAITDQDSADAIERVPGALGTTTLALILSERRKIKILPINGAAPSVSALARGTYPYFKPLYFVTPHDASEPARAFIAFIQSKQGAKILSDNGYLLSK